MNLGRALGLPGSLISEEERVRAYPLRDQAFVAHYDKVSIIIDELTIADFLAWYTSEHGKQVEKKLSCMLLIQAIDHFRAVDANEFPMLLNAVQRAALLEDLGDPINATDLNGISSEQSQEIANYLQELLNSLLANPPKLLQPDDPQVDIHRQRQTAVRRDWEHILQLTKQGAIRTAFLRQWARKRQARLMKHDYNGTRNYESEVLLVEIFRLALTQSIRALNVIPEQNVFYSLWENEKQCLEYIIPPRSLERAVGVSTKVEIAAAKTVTEVSQVCAPFVFLFLPYNICILNTGRCCVQRIIRRGRHC